LCKAAWGRDQLHDALDVFLHALKFAARQIELSFGPGDLGVRSDGRYMFQVDMIRLAPNKRRKSEDLLTAA
jgi:hypothetical protein